jgi:hypothetical protein
MMSSRCKRAASHGASILCVTILASIASVSHPAHAADNDGIEDNDGIDVRHAEARVPTQESATRSATNRDERGGASTGGD